MFDFQFQQIIIITIIFLTITSKTNFEPEFPAIQIFFE